MPAQDLRRVSRRPGAGLPEDRHAGVMRLALLGGSLALTAALGYQMHLVLAVGQLSTLELVMLVLFVINIAWINLGTVSAVLGFFARQRPWPEVAGPLGARTALLMPVYNETPERVFGAAAATLRALEATSEGAAFDLFMLSDTNRTEIWLAEQEMAARLRADPAIGARFFYRHRLRNRERKAGNIADWVRRWGSAYPQMLVLDADSLMDADTIVTLARRMAADPDLGILQTIPRLLNAGTPLARLQQFATRIYGQALARGLRAWFGDAGNYWGHNAIIRTEAFAAAAGLPQLPGTPPLGGPILSHDFVEAALIRRAGYAVRIADDLDGSYEQGPPNLIEMTARDRRWCQGNLQHIRLLGTTGLHPVSRLHLGMGVMSYLASPLWFLFLLSGMSLALYANLVPPDYFADRWSLFPTWPRIDAERAMTLFGLCMLVLFVPKFIGLAGYLREPAARPHRLRAVLGTLVEIVLSALIAPVTMLTQSRSVYEILTGRDSGWNVQSRDAERLPWRLLWRFHRAHFATGLVLGLMAWGISASLLGWMSPALFGMIVAVPVSAFLASERGGHLLCRLGLLVTPEDDDAPAIAAAAKAEAERLEAHFSAEPPVATLAGLLADPELLERHVGWLDLATRRRPGDPEPALAGALLKLSDGFGVADLTAAEAYAVASSPRALAQLGVPIPDDVAYPAR
jgi:membrane glycosyltransferase